jgi:hypothetical protein
MNTNTNIPKDVGTISFAVLSSLLAIVTAMSGIGLHDATSQNATTTTANQTGGATTQNQTSTALANLTRADFEPVTSALNSARESLMANATEDAYFSLSFADNALFRAADDEGPSASITITEITQPVRDRIDSAQDALLGGDVASSLNELNSADVELVRITQGLQAGEAEEAAGEAEEAAGEAEEAAGEEE